MFQLLSHTCRFLCGSIPLLAMVSTAAEPAFRVMTYNIHHAEGTDGRVDLDRIARVIREVKADVVALQEVDRRTSRTQNLDMPSELAQRTGLSFLFSNNYHFGGGEYGNALLTRFRVLTWTNTHYRMSAPIEQRGLLQATLEVHGRHLVLLNTHLDAGRTHAERLLALDQMKDLLRPYASLPHIFCGDFNAPPDSEVYSRLAPLFDDPWPVKGEGPGFTIPSRNPTARIDYIWISKDAPIIVERIWVPALERTASDHLPVVAELRWR